MDLIFTYRRLRLRSKDSRNRRKIHVPPEVLTNICSYLPVTRSGICAARLVSRAFCAAANPFYLDNSVRSSPAELFIEPASFQPCKKPRLYKSTFLSWTWLRIPPAVLSQLDRVSTRYGPEEEFLWYLIAYKTKSRSTFRDGCFLGRMREDPDLLCIVMMWHCRSCFDAYRQKPKGGPSIQQFLESQVPGCAATSWSECAPLQKPFIRTGFDGWNEMRTFYFPPDLTHKQKLAIETALKPWNNHPGSCGGGGLRVFCWLSGLQTHQSQPAVAARWVYGWYLEEEEQKYYDKREAEPDWVGYSYNEARYDRLERIDQALEMMKSDGMLGSEILHGHFYMGSLGFHPHPADM